MWRADVPPRLAFKKGVMFFDILTHFDKSSAAVGKFKSSYWTKLPELIKKLGLNASWGHLFFRHHATPSATAASKVVRGFNKGTTGKHFLIDECFNIWCLARTLIDLCRLILKGISIRKLPICFPPNSSFSFRHIHKADWQNSLFGKSAARSICQLNSLESYLSLVPKQRLGIYIQENQPWEIALLHAWRSNGHGEIIGTPHTTIRFWDLRYFYDSRTFRNKDKNALPTPDKIALNGPVARSAYNTGLGPIDRLIEVEALRFIETKKYKSRLKRLRPIDSVGNRKPVLLVATDLLDTNNTIQLEWAEKAVKATENNWRIVVRPHPASEFSQKKYPQWQEFVDRGDLSELLQNVDVIFCSNASSIAVDGYLAGKTILTMLNGKTFNFSPLRGIPNLSTIASAKDLCKWIRRHHDSLNNSPAQYFHLNKKLFAWKRLLS
jgi:surface carbohydrate biosynthesis protein (TIGR04326 family)